MTKQQKINRVKELVVRLKLAHDEPLSKQEIQKNEEALGVKYPEQYKEFLRIYGWLSVGEGQLGGKEGVKEALDLQKYHPERFPKNLIPLNDIGNGDYHCLVCGGEDHGKVIFWQHDAPSEETYPNTPQEKSKDFWLEASDFWTWLLKRMELEREIREEF